MKKFGLITLLFFFLGADGQCKNPSYIRLEFVFEHTERPFPTVFFFVDSPEIKIDPIFCSMIKVSKKEFKIIENIVSSYSSYLIIDSLAEIYYEIDVVKKNKKKVFGTINLNKTKKLFDKILESIQYSENYLMAKEVFEYLKANLKPKGIIK